MWHTVYLSKWSVFIQRKGGRIFEQLWRFFSSDHPTVVKTPVSSRPQCRQDSVVKTVSSRPQCRQDPSVVKTPVSSRPQCRQDPSVVKTPMSSRPQCCAGRLDNTKSPGLHGLHDGLLSANKTSTSSRTPSQHAVIRRQGPKHRTRWHWDVTPHDDNRSLRSNQHVLNICFHCLWQVVPWTLCNMNCWI